MAGNKAMLDEFNYYKAHQDEIVAGHIGEIAIIKDHAVKGYYKTMDEALEASRTYPIETYLLKDCRPKGTDVVRLYNHSLRYYFDGINPAVGTLMPTTGLAKR